jgi:hypothetical protein
VVFAALRAVVAGLRAAVVARRAVVFALLAAVVVRLVPVERDAVPRRRPVVAARRVPVDREAPPVRLVPDVVRARDVDVRPVVERAVVLRVVLPLVRPVRLAAVRRVPPVRDALPVRLFL